MSGLRVLIVTGIWPPDVGGPASHGPELGEFLRARGHDVAAGMYTRSALAARALGVPLVVKLAGDPVYERSRRLGLFDGTQEEFEAAAGTPLVRVRDRARARTRGRGRMTQRSRRSTSSMIGASSRPSASIEKRRRNSS